MPPKLFDLTTLQRVCNRMFGYTAQQVLDTAQDLYEKKLLTYPRTDSCYITENMVPVISRLLDKAYEILTFSCDRIEKPAVNRMWMIQR